MLSLSHDADRLVMPSDIQTKIRRNGLQKHGSGTSHQRMVNPNHHLPRWQLIGNCPLVIDAKLSRVHLQLGILDEVMTGMVPLHIEPICG